MGMANSEPLDNSTMKVADADWNGPQFDEFNEPIPLSLQMVLNELTELETAVSYPRCAEVKVQALAQYRNVLAKRLRSGTGEGI